MGRLAELLKGVKRIALDTNSIIYLLEENYSYFHIVREVFDLIEEGQVTGVTSTLALTEVLTRPYKSGEYTLVNEYRTLFKHFPNLLILNVDAMVAERAAWLRAQYGLRTPDAIFLATALVGEADVFITNDARLNKVKEIRIVQLGNYTARDPG